MKKTLSVALNAALLFVLTVATLLPAPPALAMTPQRQQPLAQPAAASPREQANPLYPDELDPPNTCGVARNAPFGQDMEMLLGPLHSRNTTRLDQSTSWGDTEFIPRTTMSGVTHPGWPNGDAAAVAMDAERVVAVWQQAIEDNQLVYNIWRSDRGWKNNASSLDLTPRGNPALLSLHPGQWTVFVRDQDDYIQYRNREGRTLGEWTAVPGAYTADSDPAIVSKGPHHMAVFFKEANGSVMFSEWNGAAGWREAPVSLGKPAGVSIESKLAVVSRHDNHIAVFAACSDNKLWYKEWTSTNASDWSDTRWRTAVGGVKQVKLSVASRHSGHMAVAVWRTGGYILYREWTEADGWGTKYNVGDPGFHGKKPPQLAATDGETMWLLGVDTSGNLKRRKVIDGDWTGWRTVDAGGWKTKQTLAAVVPRPHDLMVIGRDDEDLLAFKHLTSLDRAITKQSLSNDLNGNERGQVIATVDGKSVWVSFYYRENQNKWVMAAKQPSRNWQGHVFTFDHRLPDTETGKVSAAAGDIDGDGDDEVLVATLNARGKGIDLSVVNFSLFPSAMAVWMGAFGRVELKNLPRGTDINVAVGDLDGDGRQNEIVVGYRRASTYPPIVETFVYQYDDDALQSRLQASLAYDDELWDGWTWDMELAIGQVRLTDGEQLIITVQTEGCYGSGRPQIHLVAQYQVEEDPRGDWSLRELEVEANREDAYAKGEYSTALITADTNGDGLEEIFYSRGWYNSQGGYNQQRSLAAGDIDWDGKEEIIYATGSGNGGVAIYDRLHAHHWTTTEKKGAKGVALVADIDGDSDQADLVGCASFKEVSVLAVVNGAPRHYRDGAPIHNSKQAVAYSSSESSSSKDGWHVNVGTSLSLGYEQDISLLFTKIGEWRASLTTSFMNTIMGAQEEHESTTDTDGYSVVGDSTGMVVYDEAGYRCYYYDVYDPETPNQKTRSMACTAKAAPIQTAKTVDDWQEESFIEAAGSSWVDVGRPDNDVTTYPDAIPADSYLVTWHGKPKLVQGTSTGSSIKGEWSTTESQGGKTITGNTWDLNVTASVGATLGGVRADLSATAGYGEQSSRSVGWDESLRIGGWVEYYNTDDCPECQPYKITPYMQQATAVTAAGETYPYMEIDYYVPSPPGTVASTELDVASTDEVLGLPPEAPLITSTTHPDPNTWYPTSTVTFEWDQPASDPANLAGYHWNLNQSEATTPTSILTVLTGTQTYRGVADGVHYLHVQPFGDGGDAGPVSHQAVRVDTNAPDVTFALDPIVPSGLNGWYNTPVTVTLVTTDGAGSGVTAVEYSTDAVTWQPYTASLALTTETDATTIWARATDQAGHTSQPVSTTVKVDTTAPSLIDADDYRLSYASIITDDAGYTQLVLGGALSDTLSGRFMTEIKLGDEGIWRSASAVGEFPVPDQNHLSPLSDTTTLNWIYTPTFEARGAWTVWARGTDRAGVSTDPLDVSGFYWEPDAEPDLSESQVTVAPSDAQPGEVVTFTVAVRNTGHQESRVAVTNTLPAELTVLTDTVTADGQTDPDDGTVTWSLDPIWPGQTRYLFFSARLDDGLSVTDPLTLENRLDLLGYWTWEDPYGVMPPAPPTYAESSIATLTVLPASQARPGSGPPPEVMVATVEQGTIVDDPQVSLYIEATPDAESLYIREWAWDVLSATWTLQQETGWLPFAQTDDLTVTVDSWARRGWYDWTLSEGDGVKYLGVWVADDQGHATHLNDANLIYTNLMGVDGQTLDAGQRVQYRVPLRAHQLTLFNLVTLNGDADLYVWKPRFALHPHHVSNAAELGFHADTVAFIAEEEGMHILEVEVITDGTTYRLEPGGDVEIENLLLQAQTPTPNDHIAPAGDLASLLPQAIQAPRDEKAPPAQPVSLSTPYGLGDAELLPEAPEVPEEPTEHQIYFPLILRGP